MPAPRHLPKYRHYKPKNLAVVRIDGRDVYLGKYRSPESLERYDRAIAQWLTSGSSPHPTAKPTEPTDLTVNEVILAFLRHADAFYRRADGTSTGEMENLRLALRPLKKLYGGTPAIEFGPKALRTVRQDMIESGLCRRTINQRIGRIKRAFQYAVAEELIPASVHHGLQAMKWLERGRSKAAESETVKPVADSDVDAVHGFVSRQVWAMIGLQRLTGMRSGEVTIMRTCDLDRSGKLWIYSPSRHKAERHGKERHISLGPRAQALLAPWLRDDPTAYLFSPKEAMEEHRATRRRACKTPLTPSQKSRRRKARPIRKAGDRYDSRAYGHAVARACDRAFLHPTLSKVRRKDLTTEQREELEQWRRDHRWHPHQLRHSAATMIRRECGMEAARAVLGHSDLATTAIYAERDEALAEAAMGRFG